MLTNYGREHCPVRSVGQVYLPESWQFECKTIRAKDFLAQCLKPNPDFDSAPPRPRGMLPKPSAPNKPECQCPRDRTAAPTLSPQSYSYHPPLTQHIQGRWTFYRNMWCVSTPAPQWRLGDSEQHEIQGRSRKRLSWLLCWKRQQLMLLIEHQRPTVDELRRLLSLHMNNDFCQKVWV